jgi:hypothetical protein
MPGTSMIHRSPSFGLRHYGAAALDNGKAKLAALKAKTEEMTGHLIQTAEVAAGAGAAGFIAGKYGTIEILGVPLELAAGVGLNLAAHAKMAGKSSEHLHNVGDGFLAMYVGTLMRGVGVESNRPAAVGPPAAV